MSKRMVTYQVGDNKIVSIDNHDVGSGGVGDKSISRRMITYQVDDTGKITSIDGHELSGGGGGDYEIKPLTVTENGVYDVAREAYKPVRVNVPQAAQSGTLKALLDTTQSAAYLFNGYKGTSVDELISFNDTSNVTTTKYMFSNCSNLTTIPQLNTSKVTTTQFMFNIDTSLTTIPQLDTSNVLDMSYMFYNCSSLTTIPQLNTSKATNSSHMFYDCSSLTTIPQLDTSNVSDMKYMFYNCSNLTTVPELNAQNLSYDSSLEAIFTGCTKLVSIGLYGFTRSIDISSTALGHDALVAFLNQAGTAKSGARISMGSVKLALLSDEEKAIATNKGWQLA